MAWYLLSTGTNFPAIRLNWKWWNMKQCRNFQDTTPVFVWKDWGKPFRVDFVIAWAQVRDPSLPPGVEDGKICKN